MGALLLSSGAALAADAHRPALAVLWPESEPEQLSHAVIKQAGIAEAIIAMAEQRMNLRGPLTVVLGGGGEPRLSGHRRVVVMPYEHLHRIQRELNAQGGTDAQQLQVALDAFSYSLVHQLAHVAIAQQEESGRWLGEDAVADLTMLSLLEHMPNGARIARNALRLFDKQAIGMLRPSDDYWATHALNAERYWSGVCQILGSGHAVDEVLPNEHLDDAECREQYLALRNSWQQMFAEGLQPLDAPAKIARR